MSEDQMNVVVIGMPRASVLEDGSVAEMEFKNSNGSVQLLRFSPSTMMGFVNRVFELFLNQKIQEATSLGHMEVQPLPAVVTAAQEAVGGEAVILSVRLQTGLPVAFAIPPAEAEELRKQLGKAVKKARREASSARH